MLLAINRQIYAGKTPGGCFTDSRTDQACHKDLCYYNSADVTDSQSIHTYFLFFNAQHSMQYKYLYLL